MNLEETRKYIERRMGDVGLSVRIDSSGYQTIQRYTSGDKERLNQLYYKLVSVGSRQEKREVNGVTLQIAIDDLRRMDEFMDHMPARLEHHDKVDVDRLTIEQLASNLEQKVAEQIEFAVDEVRRKGGTTSAEDGGPNGTDHFVAPAERLESGISPTPGVATAGTPGKPCILVADDSPTIRAAVTKALENDFELVQASDGEKGWEALCANSNIKLVVTDLMMPGMDGFALIQRIRSAKVPGIASLPIIVVTALEDPQAKVHALVAGANDFITKRTDTLELQARVVARYQLSQIVGSGAYPGGSRTSKDPGPPPHEIAAALLGTRSSAAFGRTSVDIASAAKRYGKINGQSSNGAATRLGSVDPEFSTRAKIEPLERPTWVRALGLDRLARMSSTNGITLLATVVVVAAILGILYMNRSPSEIMLQTAETQPAAAATDTATTDPTQPVVAEDPPGTAGEQKATGAVNAEGWTTADGSPAREQLSSSGDATNAPKPSKESVVPAAKPSSVVAKQDVPSKREVKPVVTDAQALPKVSTESVAPVINTNGTRSAVDAPTSRNVEAERKAAPAKKVMPSDHVVAGESAKAEPTRVATIKQPDGANLPPLNVPQPSLPPVSEPVASTPAPAPETLVTTVGPPRTNVAAVSNTKLTKAELASLIKRFVFVYQAGDLQQFLSLFDDNIRTNDRTTKAGLRQDYEDLFRNTSMRQMVLGDISWDIKDGEAEGAANFEVRVRRINEQEVRVYQGSLTFHVEKADGKIRINRMYHGQWKAQG
jgi:CheY-like chemotaxis protein